MKKTIKELGIVNVSLDISETKFIRRKTPIKFRSNNEKIWNKHMQTSDFKPDDYYKIIEPCFQQ